LTGKRPHEGETPIQVAYKHVHEDIPAPSSVVPGIPAYVDALVARATARDREHRSADAKVLLHQLRRVRQAVVEGVTDDPDLVADLRPPASVAVPEGPIRDDFVHDTATDPLAEAEVAPPHPVPSPGAAPTAAPELTSTFDVGQFPAADGPEQARRRRRGPWVLLVAALLLVALGGGAWWYGVAR